MTKEALQSLLDQYDDTPLECDGLTRVLHTILEREGIHHQVWLGRVIYVPEPKEVSPHLWIETVKYRIDYRARMWLWNDGTIPHGVVELDQYPQVRYIGEEIGLPVLAKVVLQAMIMPFPKDFEALLHSKSSM